MSYRIAQGCFLAFLLILVLSQCGCSGGGSPTAPSIQPEGVLSPSGLFVVLGQTSSATGAIAEARWAEVEACAGISAPIHSISLVLKPYSVDASGAASIAADWPGAAPGTKPVGGYYVDVRHGGPELAVIGSDDWSATWEHEMGHLLLERSYGDADLMHTNSFWGKCL